jgi:hypothetical protein
MNHIAHGAEPHDKNPRRTIRYFESPWHAGPLILRSPLPPRDEAGIVAVDPQTVDADFLGNLRFFCVGAARLFCRLSLN